MFAARLVRRAYECSLQRAEAGDFEDPVDDAELAAVRAEILASLASVDAARGGKLVAA